MRSFIIFLTVLYVFAAVRGDMPLGEVKGAKDMLSAAAVEEIEGKEHRQLPGENDDKRELSKMKAFKDGEFKGWDCQATPALSLPGTAEITSATYSLNNTYCKNEGEVPCVYHEDDKKANSCVGENQICLSYCASQAAQLTGEAKTVCLKKKAEKTYRKHSVLGGAEKAWSWMCASSPAITSSEPWIFSDVGIMMDIFAKQHKDLTAGGSKTAVPTANEEEVYCYGKTEEGDFIHSKINKRSTSHAQSEMYLPGSKKKLTEIKCDEHVSSSSALYVISVILCLTVYFLY